MSDPEKIFSTLKVSGSLPSMPQILVQLIDSCHNQEINLQDIARIADKDAAISAKILQLVNSAFTGTRKAFTNLEQAIVYLGADAVRNLAISVSVQQVFRRVETNGLLSIDRFWHHSYFNALLARKLAEVTGYADPSEAYLAGLLHDIGKLLLWMAFPGKYAPLLLKGVRCHGARLAFLEEDKLQINHCEAGAWLCEQWGLPAFLADAIRYHHHPAKEVAQALPLTRVVSLTDQMSHSEPSNVDDLATAELYFSLAPQHVESLYDGLEEQIAQIADEFGIRIPAQAKTSHDLEPESEEVHKETSLGLINRIRDIAQLSGVIDCLMRAENREQMALAMEQGLTILFNENACLILLADAQTEHLYCQTSAVNRLSREAEGLSIGLDRCGGSLLATALEQRVAVHSFSASRREKRTTSLLDAQLLHLLGTEGMAAVPMIYRDEIQGILLLGLTQKSLPLLEQRAPLHFLVQHAAICFYLERLNEAQSNRLAEERVRSAQMVARKIAHEINNPVAILQNYVRILETKTQRGEGIEEELAIIGSELERIGQLTLGLEDLALEQTAVHCSELNLHQHIEAVVSLFQPTLPKNNHIKLNFMPAETIPVVCTDAHRLRQILLNLLNNAKEAVAGQGTLVIRTFARAGSVTVSVEDDGPGLDPALQTDIFQEGISTKNRPHRGLGLAIVQKLARQMGGSVSCQSHPGQTVFSLTIPA